MKLGAVGCLNTSPAEKSSQGYALRSPVNATHLPSHIALTIAGSAAMSNRQGGE